MLLILILCVGGYLLALYMVNRFYQPPDARALTVHRAASAVSPPSSQLTLLTWNLGYAGLGEDANFYLDGGTDWRPISKQVVQRNLMGIQTFLAAHPADLYLIQELPRPSRFNYGVDVHESVVDTLARQTYAYTPDFKTRLLPPPFRIEVGMALFTRYTIWAAASRALPLEPLAFPSFLRKHYQAMVTHLPIADRDGEWVVMHIHLAAFDEGGKVRDQQLAVLKQWMLQAYADGNYVVVGGDWNMRLVSTSFPHETDEKYLFWVRDMPADFLPDGWQIAADDRTPSVRTVHQAYVPGQNYTGVIDGFVVSPNIRIEDVQTFDLGFKSLDHHPVQVQLTALPKQ